MSGSWVDGFNAAMLRFLQIYRPDAVEIISYREDPYGGCDTCGPDIEVDFKYKCGNEDCTFCQPLSKQNPSYIRGHLYTYWGSLGYIIESITS